MLNDVDQDATIHTWSIVAFIVLLIGTSKKQEEDFNKEFGPKTPPAVGLMNKIKKFFRELNVPKIVYWQLMSEFPKMIWTIKNKCYYNKEHCDLNIDLLFSMGF